MRRETVMVEVDPDADPVPGHVALKDTPAPSRWGSVVVLLALAAVVGLSAMILSGEFVREIIGVLVLALMLALMVLRVPVALAMIAASVFGLYELGSWRVVGSTFETSAFNSVSSWQLSVVPLFILMGVTMGRGGLTGAAFQAAKVWLGRLPGGLGIATNFAGAGLSAASGSTLGISYALGRVAIPEMLRAGYSPSMATGTVAMAGTLGQLIPPSVLLVLFAGVAQTAIGPQLLAGLVPGVVLALAYGVLILVRATINPSLAPRADLSSVSWRVRFSALTGIIPVAIIMAVVLGGMFAGIMTATEAASAGALTAIITSWFLAPAEARTVSGFARFLWVSFKETAVSTASIFLLLIGIIFLTRVMTLSRLTQTLADGVVEMNLNRVTFLVLMVVVYLILGTALEPMAMLLLTVPILLEPMLALGIDMLWFGVFFVILAELAMVSPPVGMLVFVVHRLAQNRNVNLGIPVTMGDVLRGVVPFVLVCLGLLAVLIAFPELATWLPEVSDAK